MCEKCEFFESELGDFSDTPFLISFADQSVGIKDFRDKDGKSDHRYVLIPHHLRDFFHLRRFAVEEVISKLQNEYGVDFIYPNTELSSCQYNVYRISYQINSLSKFNPHFKGVGVGSDLLSFLYNSTTVGPEMYKLLSMRLGTNYQYFTEVTNPYIFLVYDTTT